MKSGKLQQAVGNGIREYHSLEIFGPLLPSNVHSITQLLTVTQDDGYTANLYNHEPTIQFSSVPTDSNVLGMTERRDKLVNCELSRELLGYLTQGDDPEDHVTVKELVSKDRQYSWTSLVPV